MTYALTKLNFRIKSFLLNSLFMLIESLIYELLLNHKARYLLLIRNDTQLIFNALFSLVKRHTLYATQFSNLIFFL